MDSFSNHLALDRVYVYYTCTFFLPDNLRQITAEYIAGE